jgi:uncharacterized protein (TIGR04255 family)
MTTTKPGSRSPISEAIIDFQVKLLEGVGSSDIEHCQDAAYPGKKALSREESTAETPAATGFLFSSADEKQLYQARSDGFTMHRLAPYESWETFRDEARRLWTLYRETARPLGVERVALRYINRLDLPLPPGELEDYLRTFPEVAPDLPQELEGFFLQLTIAQRDLESTLLLRELIVPPTNPGVVSVVLDIDLVRSAEIPPDEARIWSFIEALHARKTAIFEACITDRAREVIG